MPKSPMFPQRSARNILLFISLFCVYSITYGQEIGDYRSVGSGNWTNTSIWQVYNGTTWVSATSYPGQNTGTNDVFIEGGYSVSISSSIPNTVNSLTVGDGMGATDNFYVSNTASLPTQLITIADGGLAEWTANKSFYLPSGAAFVIESGGVLSTDTPCSAGKRLVIGTTIYSTCNGGAGADYSFTELNEQGGSLAVTPSSNSPICEGELLNLFANPSGTGSSGASYDWSGPNGYTSSDINPTILGLSEGNYTYSVTITDTSGNTNSNSVDVSVHAVPMITNIMEASRCGTGSLTLGATASSGTVSWYSSSSGGTAMATGTTFTTPSISSTTTYYVEAEENGCSTSSRSPVVATIGQPPVITAQPQDQYVADGSNAFFSVSVSGSNTYQWQVSTDDGISFSDIPGATGLGLTISSASSSEDGNFYRVLVTDTTAACPTVISNSAILTLVSDFDGDGVVDTDDLDDDNDGILDTVEANNCHPSNPTVDYVIFSEDFGTANGNRVTTPYTNYPFEDGTGSAGGSPNLNDGEYTIFEDISVTGSWAPTYWQSLGDHTTGSDRMMIVNADNTAGLEFYRRTLVAVVQDVPLNISFWVMNLDIENPPTTDSRIEPDITAYVQQGGSIVHTFNTNAVSREADGSPDAWKQYTGSFIPTSNTALELVLVNNAPGGLGNDLALDDIEVTQSFCDTDGDGIPNALQADSDNDGCNDADEAYADPNADGDNNGMYGSGTPSVNPDGTVVSASYPIPADGNGNSYYDYLETGNAPTITTHPLDVTLCPGCSGTLSVDASDADTYQWQTFNGSSWTDLGDGGIYSGTTTNTLTITNPTNTEHGNQYRVLVSNSPFVCSFETSDPVTLSVRVQTVITNRRITYRVKKN